MKAFHQILILLGALALPVAAVPLYYPVHDLFGRYNTRYSERFSNSAFSQIHVGTLRERVIELLGRPLSTSKLHHQPVWALREESVRSRYGKDHHIEIEVLFFSGPERGGDYELVQVALGPDSTVIETSKWVTD